MNILDDQGLYIDSDSTYAGYRGITFARSIAISAYTTTSCLRLAVTGGSINIDIWGYQGQGAQSSNQTRGMFYDRGYWVDSSKNFSQRHDTLRINMDGGEFFGYIGTTNGGGGTGYVDFYTRSDSRAIYGGWLVYVFTNWASVSMTYP